MTNENKQNLQYFESSSMKDLFDKLQKWQYEKQKRLQSLCVEKDGDIFCCIALTNPSEVVITDSNGHSHADVADFGRLKVQIERY